MKTLILINSSSPLLHPPRAAGDEMLLVPGSLVRHQGPGAGVGAGAMSGCLVRPAAGRG